MTTGQLVRDSLRHHRRIHIAVAAGVMAATAVLTGALLVGDSMRGSLRDLMLGRLCDVDEALVSPTFFREALSVESAEKLPAITLVASISAVDGERPAVAPKVNLLGVNKQLWSELNAPRDQGGKRASSGREMVPQPILADQIMINRSLAELLHVKQGDAVLVHLPRQSEIPADSPLGKKAGTAPTLRLTVQQVIDVGASNFSLQPNQQEPLNAFVDLGTLQQRSALDRPNQINTLFVLKQDQTAGDKLPSGREPGPFQPKMEDYGLHLTFTSQGYFNLSSDRMLLPDDVEKAVGKTFLGDKSQVTLTYLANYILAGDGKGKIPYSTITALTPETEPPLGPLETTDGEPLNSIGDDEILLNSWAADDFAKQGVEIKPGDPIKLTYFDPESTHGKVNEQTATFKLKAVVKLAGTADDQNLTPELKGVSDRKSIRDWTPPFPYDSQRVRSSPPHNEDDAYWQKYKTTPKGFISLAAGRKLWASRFGQTTTIRIAVPEFSAEHKPSNEQIDEYAKKLAGNIDPAAMGLVFQPVRQQALEAAKGTTEFNGLFIGFSLFIIVSALMLVAILFRLGIEQRAAEIGLLLAVGLSRRQVRRLFFREGAIVAMAGAAMGVPLGIGYAWLMLVGLNTLWVQAITQPFVKMHVTGMSLAIGFWSGVVVSLLTIFYALRQTRRASNRQLLAGQISEPNLVSRSSTWLPLAITAILLVSAVGCGLAAAKLGGVAQAGAFFSAGLLALAAGMTLIWLFLRRGESLAAINGSGALGRLAVRNAGRNPGRSTLSVGLMAAAAFLIVAIGAFRLDPPSETPQLDSGDGGFALYAESDQPINQDIMHPQPGIDHVLSAEDLEKLKAAKVDLISLRSQPGDDASCLNLFQSRQPRMLGVPDDLIKHRGFAWSAVDKSAGDAEKKNPWKLLDKPLADGAIPVVLDQNTAMYSLHLFGGPGETLDVTAGGGRKAKLQIVGLLENSLFQGVVLMSEANLLKLYPEVSGYGAFLIEADPKQKAKVKETLQSGLSDYGFAAETSVARLEQFAGVQNTYLATFQSLGGLGLLLGTFGMATVQLRSVFERRGELALLRATGFRRSRLASMVMLENSSLLIAGLALGVLAALAAVFPQLFGGRAHLPIGLLAGTLGLVLVTGLAAGLLAVRATLKAPLLPALRGE